MHWYVVSSLVHLFGTKPSSAPILNYFHLDTWKLPRSTDFSHSAIFLRYIDCICNILLSKVLCLSMQLVYFIIYMYTYNVLSPVFFTLHHQMPVCMIPDRAFIIYELMPVLMINVNCWGNYNWIVTFGTILFYQICWNSANTYLLSC